MKAANNVCVTLPGPAVCRQSLALLGMKCLLSALQFPLCELTGDTSARLSFQDKNSFITSLLTLKLHLHSSLYSLFNPPSFYLQSLTFSLSSNLQFQLPTANLPTWVPPASGTENGMLHFSATSASPLGTLLVKRTTFQLVPEG